MTWMMPTTLACIQTLLMHLSNLPPGVRCHNIRLKNMGRGEGVAEYGYLEVQKNAKSWLKVCADNWKEKDEVEVCNWLEMSAGVNFHDKFKLETTSPVIGVDRDDLFSNDSYRKLHEDVCKSNSLVMVFCNDTKFDKPILIEIQKFGANITLYPSAEIPAYDLTIFIKPLSANSYTYQTSVQTDLALDQYKLMFGPAGNRCFNYHKTKVDSEWTNLKLLMQPLSAAFVMDREHVPLSFFNTSTGVLVFTIIVFIVVALLVSLLFDWRPVASTIRSKFRSNYNEAGLPSQKFNSIRISKKKMSRGGQTTTRGLVQKKVVSVRHYDQKKSNKS
ncbi:hypothetical protein HELRODRAFT_161573 [Helobdella robusta]|uniref:SRCR domain-containing protein n=1 Tax=Helobdella robusta TaxID=6412 RepID=T1ERM8_HELRO|nr:hypothetical protein HELRODRAFT_161573 [Helobdella robusta]ESO02318.1 hypothetical protein HELRODRAFT_161573 [Helobdella robusta]